jgi:hypothetical protein
MIFGPNSDGTYVVEFRTAAGEAAGPSLPQSAADAPAPIGYAAAGTVRVACSSN